MPRKHIILSGDVQGVGFRYHTLRSAEQLGLAGWVRNLSNGDVEIEAEGEEEALQVFLDDVREGPSWARVRDTDVADREETGARGGFEVRY